MNIDIPGEPENLIAAAIDGAEEICDPLEGLVERTAIDPGAPFVPDTLARLIALKKEDRAAFEGLRAQLKGAGARVTALDQAIAEESGDVGGRGRHRPISCSTSRRPPNCSMRRTEPALPTSTSMATGRPGQPAPRASGAGWHAASSRRPRRAEFRGAAIGTQRDRGKGAFRRA